MQQWQGWGLAVRIGGGQLWKKRALDPGTTSPHVRRDFTFPCSLLICSPLSLGMCLLPLSSHTPSGGQALGEGGLLTEAGSSGVLCTNAHCPSALSVGWHRASSSMLLPVLLDTYLFSNLYRCLYM